MSSVITEKKRYTYEDYLKTPDDQRYELIEGEMQMTPAPVPKHQRISRKIEFLLEKFVTEQDLGEVFDAPCDVYLDDENVVQPDLLFISKERLHIIGEKNIQGAPDLVIEIISESTAYRDLVQKKRLHASFGVKEYWILIPGERSVEVYILEDRTFALFKVLNADDTLRSPLLKDFETRLEAIF
jgi:Uma2 family endonuclease